MDSEDIWRECNTRLAEGGVGAPSVKEGCGGGGAAGGRRTTKSGEAMVERKRVSRGGKYAKTKTKKKVYGAGFAGIGGSRRVSENLTQTGLGWISRPCRSVRAGATFLNALCGLVRRRKEKKGIDRGAVDVNVKRAPPPSSFRGAL